MDNNIYDHLTSESKNEIIYRREERLKYLYLGTYEQAIKALFLVNGGGVVTILAYLFKPHNSCSRSLLSIALVCFIIGLMAALSVVFFNFKILHSEYTNYILNLKKYELKEITFTQLINPNRKNYEWTVWIGYISGFSIPLGVLFGLIGYLYY